MDAGVIGQKELDGLYEKAVEMAIKFGQVSEYYVQKDLSPDPEKLSLILESWKLVLR